MTSPASPLVWPGHFPPESWWGRFLLGTPLLGPDVSFFKKLEAQQAARTEEVMTGWTDERERRVALSLGTCLQRDWGWKTPYFIPGDSMVAVIGGPDPWTYFEMDLADAFKAYEEQLGQRMEAGFWEAVIDWNDRHDCFGELVGKLTAQLRDTNASKASPGEASA